MIVLVVGVPGFSFDRCTSRISREWAARGKEEAAHFRSGFRKRDLSDGSD